MKRLFGLFALTAALAFGGLAIAQDKKADAPPAPAAAAPADAKAAPPADAAKPAEAAKPADAKPGEAPAAAPAAAPTPNKGDVAWMLTSTALVLMMSVPALALFYGGLVRSKNMLSMLMQVFVGFSLITVLWCIYGYSLAFTEGNAFFGGFDRVFLKGTFDPVKGDFSMASTFSKNTPLYELVYVAFQATFAAITCCLILGAVAERAKFSAILIFLTLWFTFSYAPVAHMVWFFPGPDAWTDPKTADAVTAKAGLIWQWGALDFAGGTVVHVPKRPREPECTWADIGKITRDLEWRPRVTFEEGVRRILAEIDYWRDAPLWDPDSIARATKVWFDSFSSGVK